MLSMDEAIYQIYRLARRIIDALDKWLDRI
jgi:hypothetical protein